MAWEDPPLTEQVAAGVKTTYWPLASHEGAHITLHRVSGVSQIVCQVWGSIDDGTSEVDVPSFTTVMDAVDNDIGFPFKADLKSIAVSVVGGTVDVTIRRNGGLAA